MSSVYGLQPTGFIPKTVQDVIDEMNEGLRALYGPSVNVSSASVFGQYNGILGDKIAELWELGESIHRAIHPDFALNEALDNICALTGVTRLAQTKSTVTLLLNLDAGVTVPAGSIVSVSTTGARFVTLAAATNSGTGPAAISVAAESENYGPVNGYAHTIDQIDTPVSGWSAAVGIPSGATETFALSDGQTLTVKIDDGSVQTATFNTGDFIDIANATAAEVAAVLNTDITGAAATPSDGTVFLESDTNGPGSAVEVTGGTANGQLAYKTDRFAGLNQDDAELGRLQETDTELRVRRERLIRQAGAGTLPSILATVAAVDGVTQSFALENTTLVTDVNGLPAKSFEIIASGGADAAIAQAIYDTKPAGIETYRDPGANGRTVAIADTQGNSHDIDFSRPTEVRIYVEVDVTVEPTVFGGGDIEAGQQLVRQALAEESTFLAVGEDMVILRFQCVALGVPGVLDVTSIKLDDVTPPVNTANFVLQVREIGSIDSGDVTVNVT
jgi:uncharacterized phage protein gp47/JayE